jgi:(p)ppGpp synthase/HD superfamily hydrolase
VSPGELLRTVYFAAQKHRDQRRKDAEGSPYVNHAILVAERLVSVGGVQDLALVQAALLHDTLEDTDTTGDELEREFGRPVRLLVEEVTDDKRLPKAERKRLQIEHSAELSAGAKQIKLADKLCNVEDITHRPPHDWSLERRAEYLEWSRRVVDGCRGANPALERAFDFACAEGNLRLSRERSPDPSPRRS